MELWTDSKGFSIPVWGKQADTTFFSTDDHYNFGCVGGYKH